MKLVCLSDTHGLHDKICDIPDGDVLIHAGDCTNSGSDLGFFKFISWYKRLPHLNKILIAGNHDWIFQEDPVLIEKTCRENNIHYLCDSSVVINGVVFYGSPYTPMFCDWAFMLSEQELERRWSNIPKETNVLITHGPAFGILDRVLRGEYVGSKALKKRCCQLPNLKLHVFGHIHEAYGVVSRKNITHINVSICTVRYSPSNSCVVFEYRQPEET